MRTSSYERKVIHILQKENINFQREKTFHGLNSSSGTPLRFDFYLKDLNILLEVEGAHHYEEAFGTGRRGLMKQQSHDKKKNSYCINNNIKLYRIPYWEIENINCFEDLIQAKYMVLTKYHNLYIKK